MNYSPEPDFVRTGVSSIVACILERWPNQELPIRFSMVNSFVSNLMMETAEESPSKTSGFYHPIIQSSVSFHGSFVQRRKQMYFNFVEYDPNPLLSLSKRRRRTSVNSATEERRLNQSNVANTTVATNPEPPKVTNSIAEKENTDTNKQDAFSDNYRERKKLKKRRKDKLKKLLLKDDKLKKKKHRCCDEHCKHRKHHKKHKKHKKHHHRSENDSTSTITVENEIQVEEPEPEPEPEVEPEELEPEQEEEYEEVNGNIIEETNIVHTKILETKAKVFVFFYYFEQNLINFGVKRCKYILKYYYRKPKKDVNAKNLWRVVAKWPHSSRRDSSGAGQGKAINVSAFAEEPESNFSKPYNEGKNLLWLAIVLCFCRRAGRTGLISVGSKPCGNRGAQTWSSR